MDNDRRLALADRQSGAILVALSLLVLAYAFVASKGFFNVDETIYFFGVYAFGSTGSFAVENGFEILGLDELRVWFLVDGRDGLVPQYPPGTAVVGGVLLDIFGARGLMAVNVAAGIGTLFVTHRLALRLFGSSDVANLTTLLLFGCTFWAEYLFAYWPHSVSIFSITLALLLLLVALDRAQGAFVLAFLAGVILGLGILFRLDGVLALPGFVFIAILYGKRPIPILTGGLIGIAVCTAILGAMNSMKYGSWNPLSYGSNGGGGGTDPGQHSGTLALFVLAFLIVILVRIKPSALTRKAVWLAALTLCAVGVFAVPQASALFVSLLRGLQGMLLDATTLLDPRPGVTYRSDGTVLFWGLPKKALLQSLPWLGVMALLVGRGWRSQPRGTAIVLVFFFSWSLLFLLRSWHGGLGSNMRYLLPAIPGMAGLAAWLIIQLSVRSDLPLSRVFLIWSLTLAALWGIVQIRPDMTAMVHQNWTPVLLFLIVSLCLLAGIRADALSSRIATYAVAVGLGVSTALALGDFTAGQERRDRMLAFSDAAAEIAVPTVFFGAPEAAGHAISNPDHLLAMPDIRTGAIDAASVRRACEAGYEVRLTGALSRGDLCLLPEWTGAD